MASQNEWHAVRWLDQPNTYGVARVDLAGPVAHRGTRDGVRRFLSPESAQRAALGRPPFGVCIPAVSFVSVTTSGTPAQRAA